MQSPDDMVAEKVKDIQAACNTLEDNGYNYLVLIAIEHRHIEIGSLKGRRFYEENYDIIEKFVDYCHDESDKLQNDLEQVGVVQQIEQTRPRVSVMPVKHVEDISATPVLSEDNLSSLIDSQHTLTSELPADEKRKHAPGNLTLINEPYSDIKQIKVEAEADTDATPEGNKIFNNDLDNLKTETRNDSDDADSDLSAMDAADYDGDNKYTTDSLITTVSQKDEGDKIVVNGVVESKSSISVDGKKRFPCNQCAKSYKRKEDLVHHQWKHSGEAPYSCNKCHLSFRSKRLLSKHKCRSTSSRTCSKPVVCEVCDASFKRNFELVVHKRIHTGEAPFQCQECGKCFRSKHYLRNHTLRHSQKGAFACDQCDKKYNRKEDLLIHQRKHTGEAPYKCDSCQRSFRSQKLLSHHKCLSLAGIKDAGKSNSHVCGICGVAYMKQSKLVVHMRNHTGEAPFQCQECGKCFRSKQYLRNHMLTHGDKGTFPCDQCDKKYNRKNDLVIHQRKHTGEAPYRCDNCQRSFRSKRMLNDHKCTFNAVNSNSIVCEICGVSCSRMSDFVVHMRIHTGEAPYKCPECGKCFRSVAYLRNHRRTHTDKDMFLCDQCEKTYKRKDDLIIHQRKHSGEKPFCCLTCGKRFISRNTLRSHTSVHSDATPYECKECGQKFARSGYLASHVKCVHSNEYSYVCETCGRSFKDSKGLYSHRQTHKDMNLACETCGKRFHRESALNSHRLIHSGVKPFRCSVCLTAFRMKKNLTKHIRRVHLDADRI